MTKHYCDCCGLEVGNSLRTKHEGFDALTSCEVKKPIEGSSGSWHVWKFMVFSDYDLCRRCIVEALKESGT
jgi:hypothetical protein